MEEHKKPIMQVESDNFNLNVIYYTDDDDYYNPLIVTVPFNLFADYIFQQNILSYLSKLIV